MSDPDFDLARLAKKPVPEPRRAAIDAAKRSGLDAFDASAKNNSWATKGTGASARLFRIATQLWSLTMNTKYLSGSALATLLIAPIVGIATFQLLNNNAGPKFITLPSTVETSAGTTDSGTNTPTVEPTLGNNKVSLNPATTPSESTRGDVDLVAKSKDVEGRVSSGLSPKIAEKKNEVSKEQFAIDMATPAESVGGAIDNHVLVEPAAPMAEGDALAQSPMGLKAVPGVVQDSEMALQTEQENRDKFAEVKSNSVVTTAVQPVSTFSVDVDTSGYSSLRRSLNQGILPDHEAVRIEEMVNYFPYGYKGPNNATEAFKANVTVTPTPWNQNTKLLHVGIKGYDLPAAEQKSANLVFLIDVSGSMDEADKLPLLKSSFRLLVNTLKPTDTVSIVTYAGDAGIVLEPTKASEQIKILNAIDNLQPGGSTSGEAGINAAYQLASRAFVKDGVNRIMLATDGDFNVGAASDEDLKKLVEEKRKTGVFLSILGFGQGNYQDNLMQTLAQNGNGIAAYIDTLSEAEKVLVQEATSSLFTIAKDVKIQVEFNPARVSEYRLIGYETRALANEDFNNDRIDAGDIGSGHTVTAIYEMTMKGAPGQTNDPLRYQTQSDAKIQDSTGEYAFVKIRYKVPTEATSRLVTQPVTDENAVTDINAAPEDVRFGIAVSAFGQKLRDEDQVANYSMTEVEALAASAKGTDAYGYRGEFMKLVRLAGGLLTK